MDINSAQMIKDVITDIGDAALQVLDTSNGPSGNVAMPAPASGNSVPGIQTNITKWKAPSQPKKSHFKKIKVAQPKVKGEL